MDNGTLYLIVLQKLKTLNSLESKIDDIDRRLKKHESSHMGRLLSASNQGRSSSTDGCDVPKYYKLDFPQIQWL
jgi:hypothetical protein